MSKRRRFDPPDLHVHAHAQGAAGVMLSFSVGAKPGHVGLLDVHHLLLNDDRGLGMVGYLSRQRTGLYHWPLAAGRGTLSLPRFLVGCSAPYVAGKVRLDDHFDDDATRQDIERELKEGNAEDAEDLIEEYFATTLQDFLLWRDITAPRDPGNPSQRFVPVMTIDPSFHALYAFAWPWMKEHIEEIEALLYPAGVPR